MSLRARGLKTHPKERPRQHRVRLRRPPALAGDMKERESPGTAGCGYAAPRLCQAKSDLNRTCPGTTGCGRAAPRLCQAKIDKKLFKKRRMEGRGCQKWTGALRLMEAATTEQPPLCRACGAGPLCRSLAAMPHSRIAGAAPQQAPQTAQCGPQ